MSIEAGSKAPDFSLKSANGPGKKDDFGLSNVTLSDNNGQKNTVILFVPLAFTGVCTQELCDITSGLADYSDLNADVIAISVDSPFAQGQWAKNENIGITLASDLNKQERYISRKSRFKSLLLDKNFEVENPKKLEELSDKNCRWPIGHPDEENFYFCGRNPVEGFSYCKLHVLYAFQPKNQKEELINKEDDVPVFLEKKIKAAK